MNYIPDTNIVMFDGHTAWNKLKRATKYIVGSLKFLRLLVYSFWLNLASRSAFSLCFSWLCTESFKWGLVNQSAAKSRMFSGLWVRTSPRNPARSTSTSGWSRRNFSLPNLVWIFNKNRSVLKKNKKQSTCIWNQVYKSFHLKKLNNEDDDNIRPKGEIIWLQL